MSSLGRSRSGCLLASLLACWAALPVGAQEQQYRERQVLDPQTDEWVDQAPATQPGPADDLGQARAWLAQNKPGKARKLLNNWIKQNPDDERHYEALFLLGETYFESRDFWKAAEQYQTVAENSSGDLFHQANRRCVDAARAFLSGQKRIFWRVFRVPAYDDGVEILDRVWERAPGTRLGELALKLKADYYFDHGDVDLAQDEYASLAKQYPSGKYVQLASLRTAEAAEAAFPGVKFDDRPLVEAETRYQQVQAAFPAYAERESVAQRLEGIRQQRADKDLDIARWYERTKQPGAAEFYYRLVLRDWPNTPAASEARNRLRAIGVRLEDTAGEGPQP